MLAPLAIVLLGALVVWALAGDDRPDAPARGAVREPGPERAAHHGSRTRCTTLFPADDAHFRAPLAVAEVLIEARLSGAACTVVTSMGSVVLVRVGVPDGSHGADLAARAGFRRDGDDWVWCASAWKWNAHVMGPN